MGGMNAFSSLGSRDRRGPVVCIGSVVADLVAHPLRAVPAPGRQALVDSIGLFSGGSGGNTAAALARLGVPVELIARAGADALGEFLWQELGRQGIGLTGLRRTTGVGTSCTLALVDPDGERRFIHAVGANAHLSLADVDWGLIERAPLVHVAGALVLPGLDGAPLAELLARARQLGALTSLDIIWDDTGRWMQMLGPALPFVHLFLPNLAEAQALTGCQTPEAAGQALLAAGVSAVVIKLGAAGCLVKTAAGPALTVPGFPAAALDATGAGDAFAAGLLAGLWRGHDLASAAAIANAVGAQCVTSLGATAGIRAWDETLAMLGAGRES